MKTEGQRKRWISAANGVPLLMFVEFSNFSLMSRDLAWITADPSLLITYLFTVGNWEVCYQLSIILRSLKKHLAPTKKYNSDLVFFQGLWKLSGLTNKCKNFDKIRTIWWRHEKALGSAQTFCYWKICMIIVNIYAMFNRHIGSDIKKGEGVETRPPPPSVAETLKHPCIVFNVKPHPTIITLSVLFIILWGEPYLVCELCHSDIAQNA